MTNNLQSKSHRESNPARWPGPTIDIMMKLKTHYQQERWWADSALGLGWELKTLSEFSQPLFPRGSASSRNLTAYRADSYRDGTRSIISTRLQAAIIGRVDGCCDVCGDGWTPIADDIFIIQRNREISRTCDSSFLSPENLPLKTRWIDRSKDQSTCTCIMLLLILHLIYPGQIGNAMTLGPALALVSTHRSNPGSIPWERGAPQKKVRGRAVYY